MKLLALASLLLAVPAQEEKPIRIGMIGLDTSHVGAFTQLLNDSKSPSHVPGAKVVCAFKGGSPDVEASRTRVDGFTKQLQERFGVEIVDSIEQLVEKVDAVMVESVDGRPHLAQARPALKARKPVFIDKPMAGSYRDGREIARLAKECGAVFFSASSQRFGDSLVRTKADPGLGKILGCDSFGPCSLEPHHPDLFWYGVHGVEMLFAVMGPGCESVRRVHTADIDIVVGKWKDGRVGTYRGIRKGPGSGATILGDKGVRSTLSVQAVGAALRENKLAPPKVEDGYRNLVVEIVKFFKTGVPPVPPEECVEVLAFMQAADVSKERGGAEVRLEELDR
jgi:predicted dehydrogenase